MKLIEVVFRENTDGYVEIRQLRFDGSNEPILDAEAELTIYELPDGRHGEIGDAVGDPIEVNHVSEGTYRGYIGHDYGLTPGIYALRLSAEAEGRKQSWKGYLTVI